MKLTIYISRRHELGIAKLTVVVKIKEDCQQKSKRNCKENIPYVDIPEVHQPLSIESREESFTRGQRGDINISHMANVDETSEENDRQGSTIVFQEFPDISLEETATAELLADPTTHKHKEGNHDAQVCRRLPNGSPLPGQDLDTLLEIDKGYVEAKDIARETGHVCQGVARIGYSKDPVHDQGPTST